MAIYSSQDVVLPVLTGVLAFVLTVYVVNKRNKRTTTNGIKKVPGPRGWPLIGYMPYLSPPKLRSNLNALIDQYGPIFSLKFGSWDTVVITDYELIKKAFGNADFSYRPKMFLFDFVTKGYHGLAASNGELWAEHRRFALRHLRDLGMGRSGIETHIQKEALEMIETLKKTVGQPVDFNNNLNIAITNIVWALVAGKRMPHDDPIFLGYIEAVKKNMETGAAVGVISFLPWLINFLPKSWIGLDSMEQRMNSMYSYFEEIIKEHKDNFDPDDLRDYTDLFIDEQKRQGEGSTFTDLQLLISMNDLFVGGGETTATTLRWTFLLLSWYPEIQKKLQEEIDSVIGRERLPNMNDRDMMPYTEAVIHEVQRFADISPLGVPHASNDQDVEFEGYTIPKDTWILSYLSGCHRSKRYWSKPDEFYPEHFLDESGKLKHNIDGFIPFSTGKRRCIGENLAKVELFYFITYFFQTFNFNLCQNDPKPSLQSDPKGGLAFKPMPYKVVLQIR